MTEEMESVYANLQKIRQQLNMNSVSEQESIYDTLERVVEQQQNEVNKSATLLSPHPKSVSGVYVATCVV